MVSVEEDGRVLAKKESSFPVTISMASETSFLQRRVAIACRYDCYITPSQITLGKRIRYPPPHFAASEGVSEAGALLMLFDVNEGTVT